MCLIDLTPTQIHQVRSIRQIVKVSNRISEVGGLLSCLVNARDPTSLFMMPLLNMLENVKYTGIVLPGNIQLSLSQNDLEEIEKHRVLRSTSEARNIFDEKLVRIGIVSFLTLLLSGVLKAMKLIFNESKFVQFLQKCSFALQWNILASLFIQMLGYVVLFPSEASEIQLESHQKTIILLVVLSLTIFLVYKIVKISSEPRENDQEEHL